MSLHQRRALRGAPYTEEHAASLARVARHAQRPKGFGPLLTWFSEVWAAELPERLHARGVWRDRLTRREADDGAQPVGGSILGSPNLADPFRRLMENSPFETELAVLDNRESLERHYARPCHAAVARIAHHYPMAARWLAALAFSDFDWQALALRRRWSEEETRFYLERILELLWSEFEEAPHERWSGGAAVA